MRGDDEAMNQHDLNARYGQTRYLPLLCNDRIWLCGLWMYPAVSDPSPGQTVLRSDSGQFKCLVLTKHQLNTITPTSDRVVLEHCDVGDDWCSWSEKQDGG